MDARGFGQSEDTPSKILSKQSFVEAFIFLKFY
jgi:hypothetical protein